jgi:ribonuclease J
MTNTNNNHKRGNPRRKEVVKTGGHKSSHGPSHSRTRKPGGKTSKPGGRPHGGQNNKPIPEVGPNDIRIIPLGGVEEVGRNMTVVETANDIVLIDAGFQFTDEDTPGIDYILPNIKYLEDKKDKIRGLFVTHGHLDHIGALPYIMERIGNPPVYTREFGRMMIQKRQEEFPHLANLTIKEIKGTERIAYKDLKVQFFVVDHSIPDAIGLIIETPYGDIATTGDVKIDHVDGVPTKKEFDTYGIFKDRNILLLMLDSTNIENPGFSLPEAKVVENVDAIMSKTKGRLIIAMFASNIDRMIEFIKLAEKYNKKVVMEGRSMKANMEIAKQIGLVKSKDFISIGEMADYPPERLLILATGAQGEEFAALMRMANNTHRNIKLEPSDTILLSSSIIPGNEKPITKLKDNLYRHQAQIITYRDSDIHASGHGNREELRWIHEQVPYKFFMPIHGHHYMLRMHADMAKRDLKVPKENVVIPDNGSIVEIQDSGQKIVIREDVEAPSDLMMVDGFEIGDKHEIVIRDRHLLSEDGFVVVVATVNTRTGKLRKSPDIISRGFIYLRDNQDLLDQSRLIIKKSVETSVAGQHPINFEYVKKEVTDDLRKFLFQQTAKNPIVIPVVLGV